MDQPIVIGGAAAFGPVVSASEGEKAVADVSGDGGAAAQAVSAAPAPELGVSQSAATESDPTGDVADYFTLLGVPLAGELPIDLTEVEDWVESLLAEVGVGLPAEEFDSETYAVLTGAAFLAGWVAYGVYGRPRRRPRRGAPGFDSVLAYWDERNDTPPR
jgi:hypothetical protein